MTPSRVRLRPRASFHLARPGRLPNEAGTRSTRTRCRAVIAGVVVMTWLTGFAPASVHAQPQPSLASVETAQATRPERPWMLAQAGSSGGSFVAPKSIGKTDKSISGGPPASAPRVSAPPRVERKKRAAPRRAARPQSPGWCEPCTRTLRGAIAGRWESGLIRAYVEQGIGAYENCRRAAAGMCPAGDRLVNQLRGCRGFTFSRYRQCIRNAVPG